MPPLSLLIKPVSSKCNMKCEYCFYHSESNQRNISDFGKMSDETLRAVVKNALDYAEKSCTFVFQGGEPIIAGLEFYESLIKYQGIYNKNNVYIQNCIQTNGTLIDEQWAKFLSKNNFLVGISLDGNKDVHDRFRTKSFDDVMNTVELLDKHGVNYNVLTVVTSYTVEKSEEIYEFFKKNNFKYLQFIPCLNPLGEEEEVYNYSLSPDKYAKFLKTVFDLWYDDIIRGNYISIRMFDNIINMILGSQPEQCSMAGHCIGGLVIESDGGVYPCDFYVLDEWLLGNIQQYTVEELRNSKRMMEFFMISNNINSECEKCRWYSLCRGGCRRNREPLIDGTPSLNYYCKSYKQFFEYTESRFVKVANAVFNFNEAVAKLNEFATTSRGFRKIVQNGRNEGA